MRSKIYFPEQGSETFEEVFTSFIISQTSKGVSATTIRNYHSHLKGISKHLDITMPFSALSKRHLESMVVSMREAGLAHNTVATYLRVINTFLNWANREGLTSVSIPNIKEKDTVKETYTDAELLILLKKPEKKCDFTEYRNWVIINYLLNAGCRAATVRNIQNRDVDLENRQVVFRHNKNGKIQVSPLCSQMVGILADCMAVRKGKPDDYLFCNQYGEMLSENALRLAVALIGIPSEVFTEIGVRIKDTEGWSAIMPCCLVNGSDCGYVPTQAAYDKGGYEARPAHYKAGTDDIVVAGSKALLNDLKSQ